MNSSLFHLNWKDVIKSAIMAALAIIGANLYTALSSTPPHLPTWPQFLDTLKLAGAAAGIYILKNLLTDSQGKFVGKV